MKLKTLECNGAQSIEGKDMLESFLFAMCIIDSLDLFIGY